jgi:hypothetical protein
MARPGPRAKADAVPQLSATLKNLTGATSLSDPKVGTLLAEWADSHSHAKSAFTQAASTALYAERRKECERVLKTYAHNLIPGDGACELLITMNAPKQAFRALSEYMSERVNVIQALPDMRDITVPRPMCTRNAFEAAWRDSANALNLAPTRFVEGPPVCVALEWPLHEWAAYITSRPTLLEALDFTQPLTFIVRGDGYPTSGESWANLTISLTNFGEKARSPAFLWLIGLAACSEKEMVVLGDLWSDNIKVAP